MRKSVGGPAGQEYLVEHGGERAWFDATTVEDRDGVATEILIDAKGRYQQFVDPDDGEFRKWWANQPKTGLQGEMDQARRQVRVANGRPVEWRCAERAAATAFNLAISDDDDLVGRLRAVYRPMADEAG